MEWRVRECRGGFAAVLGMAHEGGVLSPRGIGVTMPAFIEYEYHRFDTKRQAESYVKQRQEE